jgi:hypothetical protein
MLRIVLLAIALVLACVVETRAQCPGGRCGGAGVGRRARHDDSGLVEAGRVRKIVFAPVRLARRGR